MQLIRPGKFAARLMWSWLLLLVWIPASMAQGSSASSSTGPSLSAGPALPPLDVSFNKPPARDPNAIAIDGWLLLSNVARLFPVLGQSVLQPGKSISRSGRFRGYAEPYG